MSNEEFVAQDTKDIQIQSVCAFMEQFNYLLHIDGKFYSNTFWDWEKGKREEPYFKGCEVISFNKACELHNSDWSLVDASGESCKVEATYMSDVFNTDTYTLNKAMACKIVQQVFLQCTKYGRVVCHKHLVKFVCESYQYMFLEQDK